MLYGVFKYGVGAYSTAELAEGSAVVSASSSATAVCNRVKLASASASITSSASSTASAIRITSAAVSVSSSAASASSVLKTFAGTSTVSSSVSASGRRVPQGSVLDASITTITLGAGVTRVRESSSAVSSDSGVSVNYNRVRLADGTSSSEATAFADGVFSVTADATTTVESSASLSAYITAGAVAQVTAESTASSDSEKIHQQGAIALVESAFNAHASATFAGASAIYSDVTYNVVGQRIHLGYSEISAASSLYARGIKKWEKEAVDPTTWTKLSVGESYWTKLAA